MATEVDVAKRLDFATDLSDALPRVPQRDSVLQALAEPSLANLQRALETVHASHEARTAALQAAAKEHAAGSGASDLRRLRRQFSSLKNTFCLYDTKENFIDGLMQGLPDGSEEARLQELEAELDRQAAALKQVKAQNRQAEAGAAQLLERIAVAHDEYTAQHASLASQLGAAARDAAAADAAAAEAAAQAGSRPQGLDEAAVHARMAAAAAEARMHEAAIAAQEAEAAELQAAIRSEEDELQALQAQARPRPPPPSIMPQPPRMPHAIGHAEAAAAAAADGAAASEAAPPRFAGALDWCAGLEALLAGLGGVALEAAPAGELRLRLAVHADAAWAPEPGASMTTAEYGLALRLQPGGDGVAAAALTPPDVDSADIVAAAAHRAQAPGFVVREVRARLAQRLRRRLLIEGVCASYPLLPAPAGADDTLVAAELPHAQAGAGAAVAADVRVPTGWPGPGQTLSLEALRSLSADASQGAGPQSAAEGGAGMPAGALAAVLARLRVGGAHAFTGSLEELLAAAATAVREAAGEQGPGTGAAARVGQ